MSFTVFTTWFYFQCSRTTVYEQFDTDVCLIFIYSFVYKNLTFPKDNRIVLHTVYAGPVEMSFIDVDKARLCKGELFLIYNLQWIACAAYRE